ncbi:MAG TPA: DUF308 domain-containing protein [Polyangia bacterium]|nr:DUF308 domain-containing protein [Polyangia bacterium]
MLPGALLIVLGILFIIVPKAAGRASAIYLGLLLAVTGLVEAFAGRPGEPEQHRSLLLGGGSLALVIGLIVLARPAAASSGISWLFSALLLAAGLQAVWTSTADHYPGWQWDCLFGSAAVIFGIAMVAAWPSVTLWLPGSLVGFAVIVRGATMLVGGVEARDRPRSVPTA